MSRCRQRISIVTWLIGFALALDLVLRLPTWNWQRNFFGTPLLLTLDHSLLLLVLLVLLVGSGARWVVDGVNPTGQRLPLAWALPVAWGAIALLALQQAHDVLQWTVGLLLSLAIMATILESLCLVTKPGHEGYLLARFILSAAMYLAAGILFLFIYATRVRSLLSATLVSLISFLLVIELLRNALSQRWNILFVAFVDGLVMGEVTWLFNHLALQPVQAALLLLLVFYLVGSISFHLANRDFFRRLAWEYLAVAVVALLIIFWRVP